MLSLAEYTASSAKLKSIALGVEEEIASGLVDVSTKQEAIKLTKPLARQYYRKMQGVVTDTFSDVADNALSYYSKQAGIIVPDKEGFIKKIVQNQFKNPYYGLTLNERFGLQATRLDRNITRSAQVGKNYEGLRGLLTKPYPFGAQYNFDKRILLSQSQKIEQDVAKEVAEIANIRFARWKLSGRHTVPDVCDDIANGVDKATVAIIKSENLDIEVKGLYLIDSLPHPPHPNCQCEWELEDPAKIVRKGTLERAVDKLKELIKWIQNK